MSRQARRDRHKQANGERHTTRRTAKKPYDKCSDCPSPPVPGRSRCRPCLIAARVNGETLARQRAADGLCVQCGKAPKGEKHKLCDPCRKKNRERVAGVRKSRRDAGLCERCGLRPKIGNVRQCETCWFVVMSHEATGTTTHAEELRALFYANGGRCAYSGAPLEIGVDASLDHRLPVTKGGTDDVGNLQWVHAAVNQMKWNFTEGQFFAWIRLIHAHRLSP